MKPVLPDRAQTAQKNYASNQRNRDVPTQGAANHRATLPEAQGGRAGPATWEDLPSKRRNYGSALREETAQTRSSMQSSEAGPCFVHTRYD